MIYFKGSFSKIFPKIFSLKPPKNISIETLEMNFH